MMNTNTLKCILWGTRSGYPTPSGRLDGVLLDLVLLAVRVYIAWIFLKSGLTKIEDWDTTVALFQDEYQVPVLSPYIAALLGTAGELIFSVMLIVGFLGRWAALGLFLVNAMAVISYPQLFEFECPAAVQSHFYWGAGLLILFVTGVGRISVDWLLNKRMNGCAN